MVRLVSTKDGFRYDGRPYNKGDEFDASAQDALVLTTIGAASVSRPAFDTREREAVVGPTKRKYVKSGKYSRRDRVKP